MNHEFDLDACVRFAVWTRRARVLVVVIMRFASCKVLGFELWIRVFQFNCASDISCCNRDSTNSEFRLISSLETSFKRQTHWYELLSCLNSSYCWKRYFLSQLSRLETVDSRRVSINESRKPSLTERIALLVDSIGDIFAGNETSTSANRPDH